MKMLLQKIAKLIDVKSLISLLFAICLSIAFLQGRVNVKDYLTVCTMAFTFFFSYQNNKKANTDKED
jgi:Ca2+/Na+ antiporter